jgi:AcrR family transcriptional regulator
MSTAPAPTTDRRAAIIGAALQRFLAQGVAATTMKQIQRDAGTSNGSLFHHFASKEMLAAAVYVDCAARYQRAFLDELDRHEDAEAAVQAIVRMHLRWCADHPQVARFLITMSEPEVMRAAERELADHNDRFARALRSWWKPHAHYGILRPLTPAQSQALWLGPAQELVRAWVMGLLPDAPDVADSDVLADAAWLCLRADSTSRR